MISLIDYKIKGEYLIEIMEFADKVTLESIISNIKNNKNFGPKKYLTNFPAIVRMSPIFAF